MKFEDTAAYNDKLVQDTLREAEGKSRYATMDDVNENPVMKLLIELDALDPLSAAVVAADTLAPGGFWNVLFDKLPAEVAKTWTLLHTDGMMAPDCKALFEANDDTVVKLAVAAIAAACADDNLRQELGVRGYAANEMVMELSETCAGMTEQLIETKSWAKLPPPLIDKFVEGMEFLKDNARSPLMRKGLAATIVDLKTAIAQGVAEDMAAPAPEIDPASPFEQLKGVARKKYRL